MTLFSIKSRADFAPRSGESQPKTAITNGLIMFESLTERLSGVFRSFGQKRQLDEQNIQAGLREVRLALLEADVNFKVVKDFVDQAREKCLGQAVLKGVSPAQQVVKIIHDQLVDLLGGGASDLNLGRSRPAVIMLVGLQGSGKTTSAAKIANYLRKRKQTPYLAPADVYRPAAIDQLGVLAKQLDMPFFPSTTDMDPVQIAKDAVSQARRDNASVVMLDTAGRLHVDEPLMQELVNIKEAVQPDEILFVADALTGQDAVNVAKAFNDRLGITGVVLTKMDGDARGGAALSIRAVTGAPVKFVGMGEKLSEIEVFHPDRIAGRILGMGDVLTLVEKAQSEFDEQEIQALERKMRKASFDLEDFRTQMRRIKKIGSFDSILKMIPGMGALSEKLSQASDIVPEKEMVRVEAIINSMTMEERRKPEMLNGSRRLRIARGSGVTVADVNQLVRKFEQMRKMMQGILASKGGRRKLPGPGSITGFGGMHLPGAMSGMPGIPVMPQMPSKSAAAKKRKKKEKIKRKKK